MSTNQENIKYRYLNEGEPIEQGNDEYWDSCDLSWETEYERTSVGFDDTPIRRPMTPAEMAADELLAVLKSAPLGLHKPDEQGPCLCSQCEFANAVSAAIAKAEGGAE